MQQNPTQGGGAVVFDRARALAGVDDDLELLCELIELFLEDSPRLLTELGEAVASGDAEAVMRAAHTLKGSVSVLGAPVVTDLAGELEAQARNGDLSRADALHTAVVEAMARLAPHLENVAEG